MTIQAFPHLYSVSVAARPEGPVTVASKGLVQIQSDAPAQFGGPGDCWAPETMLVAAVADCYALTFRAVAQASGLQWRSLGCLCTGTLDSIDKATCFTHFDLVVTLAVASGTSEDRARRLLEKAEQHCLVTSSLSGAVRLVADVLVDSADAQE